MLVKPIIKDVGMRKLCSFHLDTPKLKELSVDVHKYENAFCRYITEVRNKQGKLLGKEFFSMFDNEQDIVGLDIIVEPEYRNKNYNIGEILRLVSIIEMLENKINSLKIYSKDSAIYFHSKYNFVPNIKSFQERDKALESIVNNDNKELNILKNIAAGAEHLLQKTRKNDSPALQRSLCCQSNDIIKDYIENVLKLGNKEYKNFPFKRGMDMVLTHSDIIKNRKTFNTLFEKHGIDYEI